MAIIILSAKCFSHGRICCWEISLQCFLEYRYLKLVYNLIQFWIMVFFCFMVWSSNYNNYNSLLNGFLYGSSEILALNLSLLR